MAEEQPQDLSTGISAGTGDRDRRHAAILHGYADSCKLILQRELFAIVNVLGSALTFGRPGGHAGP
jgi:hypothetical protein